MGLPFANDVGVVVAADARIGGLRMIKRQYKVEPTGTGGGMTQFTTLGCDRMSSGFAGGHGAVVTIAAQIRGLAVIKRGYGGYPYIGGVA